MIKDGLWNRAVDQKYIKPGSFVDFVRNPKKFNKNVSIKWKAMV
jgi:hypothetical protein